MAPPTASPATPPTAPPTASPAAPERAPMASLTEFKFTAKFNYFYPFFRSFKVINSKISSGQYLFITSYPN